MATTRQFVVRRSGKAVFTYTVKPGVCRIGRSPENDIVLPDGAVSPRHAEARTDAGATVLADAGSDGGTFVAGVRIPPHQSHSLGHGDVIAIGPFELVFRFEADEAAVPRSADVAQVDPEQSTAWSFISDAARSRVALDDAGARPPGETSRYMRYLPPILHDSAFLSRFLQMFEAVWEPLEQRQDHIDVYFNPLTCPVEWLPWLADWFGVALADHWPEARKRAFVHRAIDVYRWRGTAYGLARVVETCTGARADIVTSPESPFVFRVTVQPPPGAGSSFERDVDELIATHKPAHAGYILEILR